MARRFQKAMTKLNVPEETLEVLRQLRGRYEKFHYVHYSDEALAAMVRLTNRYIYDRYFPDEVTDVLDKVEASMHLKGRLGENDKVASLRQ